jgi:DNA polymerase-3 subunit gamma/tau
MYTVLARKYRSQTFDDVIGQEPISQTLKNAIKTGKIAHAFLFTGTRGIGKTTMARILAKALNCLSSQKAPGKRDLPPCPLPL